MSLDRKKQEILDKISIVDVVSEYLNLKQKGNMHWGLCPFHNEKTPSFSVTENKNMFYCFGCNKGGSVFDFLIEMENLSFFEAFKQLAKKAGVEIETQKESSDNKHKTALVSLYNKITGSFNYILLNKESGENARNYLTDRGISKETIMDFKLGYAPPEKFWLYEFLKEKSYSESFLAKSGIFTKKNNRISLFSNRIMFPIINTKQDTIAFSGRKLKENDWGGKYINSPETDIYTKGETIFGIHTAAKEIRGKKEFILVEGNFDVLAFYQSGIRNVVAPLGTAFTEKQAKYLKRYATKCMISFDPDPAGIEATLKSAIILEKYGISNHVIDLPKGKDPSAILEKEGPEALNKLTKYHINTFEYLVTMAVDRFGIRNSEGKESVLKFITPYLDNLGSELKKEDSFRYLSNILGIGINAVYKDYTTNKRKIKFLNTKKITTDQPEEIPISLDLFLLIALVENIEAFKSVRNVIDIDDLEDSRAKSLYIILESMYRSDTSFNEGLLSMIKDKALKEVILHKLSTGEYRLNAKQIIKDGVNRIRQRKFEKKCREIEINLRKKDLTANRIELDKLLSEKKFIDEELLRIKGS